MKKSTHCLIIALLTAFLVAGCASTRQPGDSKAPTADSYYDQGYIGAVEQKARDQGVDVYWVSPPRRAAKAEDNGS